MIPRCRPERARMCEAPLSRNADFISEDSPLRSPVSRALIRADVPSEENGMLSIIVCSEVPIRLQATRNPGSGVLNSEAAVAAASIPHPKAAVPITTHDTYALNPYSLLFKRRNTATKITIEAIKETDEKSLQNRLSAYAVMRTPAANGRANPAISLSTFI